MHFYCTRCRKSTGSAYQPFCECGGMTEVEYDLAEAKLTDSDNPYIRFADLLPIASTRDKLPRDAVYTPTIHAKALGSRFGMPRLFLKTESAQPTRSTKDRMAAVSVGFLWERGVRTFCTSSTGNSSTAYAHAIRAFPDMTLYLFTAEDFVTRVQHADHPQVVHFGMRDASFVEAFNHAGIYAGAHQLVKRPHGIAEAILRGDPSRVYPYVKDIVVESGGDFVSVTEGEIRAARTMIEELEGLSPCFSASTALAGLIKQVRSDRFPRTETVLVNLTGGDRPRAAPGGIRWLRRADDRWVAVS